MNKEILQQLKLMYKRQKENNFYTAVGAASGIIALVFAVLALTK